MIGKHANRLREARGQFSSQSHEPFLRKCLYKDTIPENMADPPPQKKKKSGKLRKSAESLPFIEGNVFTTFQTISSSGSLTKKILTFNLHNCIPTDGKGEEQAEYHNVPQFALSRMIIVAWPAFSASKRILGPRFLCSKP